MDKLLDILDWSTESAGADDLSSLIDTAPVTGGRGTEVADVVDMLAELRWIQKHR